METGDAIRLGVLVLAAAAVRPLAPPVAAGSPDQLLATLNRAWTAADDRPFLRSEGRSAPGLTACSGALLCITQDVEGGAVRNLSLTGAVDTQERSRRYLQAQAMLVGLLAPGASARPALTADRLAVDDGRPASAQLGPTCMRVTPSAGRALESVFFRGRCDG